MQQAEMASSTCRRCGAPGKCESVSLAPSIVVNIGEALREEDLKITELYNVGSVLRTACMAMETLSEWHNVDKGVRGAISDIQQLLHIAGEKLESVAGAVESLNATALHNVAALRSAA